MLPKFMFARMTRGNLRVLGGQLPDGLDQLALFDGVPGGA